MTNHFVIIELMHLPCSLCTFLHSRDHRVCSRLPSIMQAEGPPRVQGWAEFSPPPPAPFHLSTFSPFLSLKVFAGCFFGPSQIPIPLTASFSCPAGIQSWFPWARECLCSIFPTVCAANYSLCYSGGISASLCCIVTEAETLLTHRCVQPWC